MLIENLHLYQNTTQRESVNHKREWEKKEVIKCKYKMKPNTNFFNIHFLWSYSPQNCLRCECFSLLFIAEFVKFLGDFWMEWDETSQDYFDSFVDWKNLLILHIKKKISRHPRDRHQIF